MASYPDIFSSGFHVFHENSQIVGNRKEKDKKDVKCKWEFVGHVSTCFTIIVRLSAAAATTAVHHGEALKILIVQIICSHRSCNIIFKKICYIFILPSVFGLHIFPYVFHLVHSHYRILKCYKYKYVNV